MVRFTSLPSAAAARPALSTSTATATAPSMAARTTTTTATATVDGAQLSSAGRQALTKLFVLRGGDPAVARVEALEDPSLWCLDGLVVVAQGNGIAGHERGTRDATGGLHVDTLVP